MFLLECLFSNVNIFKTTELGYQFIYSFQQPNEDPHLSLRYPIMVGCPHYETEQHTK